MGSYRYVFFVSFQKLGSRVSLAVSQAIQTDLNYKRLLFMHSLIILLALYLCAVDYRTYKLIFRQISYIKQISVNAKSNPLCVPGFWCCYTKLWPPR